MTRETKIGLLVGLTFIIVIGILLSDHLSSTNEPPGAPLRVAGDILRSGLGQPGGEDVAPVLRAPQSVAPQQPVVTNEELHHRVEQPPVHFVPQPHGQAITPDPNLTNANAIERLRQNALQQGQDLVPADNSAVVNNNAPLDPQQPLDLPPVVKSVARTYQAQPGDSLSTIALKAYGSSCRANREAIVTANPSLEANRDLIVAGRTYTIPPLTNAQGTPATPLNLEKPAVAASQTYTVKPHDTLWSIAISEVGTPNAVAAIEELNKGVLNGSDRVRPNTKLMLPSKKNVE